MTCGCSAGVEIYGDVDEYATIYSERRINRSRKAHRCVECGDEIPVGSRCCNVSGLFDGSWFNDYRCLCCAALAEMFSTTRQLCVPFGSLREACDDDDRYGSGRKIGEAWAAWRTKFFGEAKPA